MFRFFDRILVAFIAVLLLGVGYMIQIGEYLWSGKNVLLLVVVPLGIAAGSALSFRASPEFRGTLVLSLVFGTLSLYGVELFLGFESPDNESRLPYPLPEDFDKRDEEQVVEELRAEGEDAFPVVSPQNFLDRPLEVHDDHVQPLAGVADAAVVLCNESGEYTVYQSDRYGFNNPDEVWDRPKIRLGLVGDSFVEGQCVPPDKSFASLIRAKVPASLNVGYSGNGSLLEYASLREYLVDARPKEVLWFFYPNDLDDLSQERENVILSMYMSDRTFNQDLIGRAGEIDEAMRFWINSQLRASSNGISTLLSTIKQFLRLSNLRASLGLIPEEYARVTDVEVSERTLMFGLILGQANALVREWGGVLRLVYLPDFSQLEGETGEDERDAVLNVARDAGVPVLDLTPLFLEQPDPLSLFPFRTFGHYNEAGHALVARAVLDELGR